MSTSARNCCTANHAPGSKVVFYSNWLFYTLFIPLPIKHANTVMTILGFTSTRSSGRAYTLAPILLAIDTAYLFFGGNKNWGSIPVSQGHNMRQSISSHILNCLGYKTSTARVQIRMTSFFIVFSFILWGHS